MSETPNKYIGTYVDFNPTDSTDPSDYTWSRFEGLQGEKGENGIPGTNGENGKTSYLHIAYATNSTGTTGFSIADSTNKTYIGQYTDFTQADSTDPSKYNWTLIKGDKGEQGVPGQDGAKGDTGTGVKEIEEQYYLSTSETKPAGGSWKTTQDAWIPERYLWTRSKITWTDDTETYTTPILAEGINNANSAVNDLENDLANNYYTKEETTASVNIKSNEVTTDVTSSVTASILTLLNNGYLTAEQVEALVEGNTEEIATIKSQVEQTVTDEDVQIAINTALEGGVSYLKNTLFTINAEGLWIATSQDEFNAKYDNTGMYLYSYEEMIAKYTKDGAELKNLKINGEIETGNLRIMDVVVEGEKRTHIHWIGG